MPATFDAEVAAADREAHGATEFELIVSGAGDSELGRSIRRRPRAHADVVRTRAATANGTRRAKWARRVRTGLPARTATMTTAK